MSQTLKEAEKILLEPAGISNVGLSQVLSGMMSHQIDYADVYFQRIEAESWYLEEGIIKQGDFSIDQGVGVRANSGEKTGFAFSNDIALPELEQAAKTVKGIAVSGKANQVAALVKPQRRILYPSADPILSLTEREKLDLLKAADHFARISDPRVKQVMVSLSGSHEVILIATLDGQRVADIRPLVRMNVQVVVEENGRLEKAMAGGGGRHDYQYFIKENKAKQYAEEAVRQALVSLTADPAPAGTMTVVLGHGWPGVLLHEAIGHGLEGDFNRKGSSAFSRKIGERIASPICNIVDDGTIIGRRGSLTVDDEGTPTECTTLIEDGILRTYMQDKLNARLMGMKPTGNGRRESYAHMPIPRMTNTYMLPGDSLPDEIIGSVKRGIYAVNFAGGQVDITSGKFVFTMSEAYLIENGKVTKPVKGATLIGNGPDVLTRVSMVGNDLQLDSGIGVCGKEGQSVPVGVGQPTLRVDDLTVGGTG